MNTSTSAIEAMLAKHELLDLLARFDDAAITNDHEVFRGLWAENPVWEIGAPIPMKAEGTEAILEALSGFKRQNLFFFRLTGRPVIEIDGDEARLRSPTIELAGRAGNLGYGNVALYTDHAVRIDGVWRFRSRSYRYLWVDTQLPLAGKAVSLEQAVLSEGR